MKVILFLAVICSCTVNILFANIIRVPQNYSSIQTAINNASTGDTIIVSRGTYFENINFRGKRITLTSQFIFSNNLEDIEQTIINGSQPVHPDTASCVLIISGEDSTTVLQGFTITGGKGTAWPDEHSPGTFREGGGILTALSSPVIQYNFIKNNEAIDNIGLAGAGGGGIRSGDGFPKIRNNVIINNKGRYGGGVVLNHCSALVENNIIASNTGGEDYGGGGVWINNTNGIPNRLQNNTIISNRSALDGGGVLIYSSFAATIKNTIIYGNNASTSPQIGFRSGGTAAVTYSNVEGGISGAGNFSSYPSFADNSFYLKDNSPCIDAGDPDVQFNDVEDPSSPGNALWPSKGTLRNDVGVYGGPYSSVFIRFSSAQLFIQTQEYNLGLILPGETVNLTIPISNKGASPLLINSASVMFSGDINIQNSFPILIGTLLNDTIKLTWIPQVEENLLDTLLIYHNDLSLSNPYKISLRGSTVPSAFLQFNTSLINYGNIDASIERVDTTLYIYNTGTKADSVSASINFATVTPDSALDINPRNFIIPARDSIAIMFTIYPSRVIPGGSNIFQPKIIIDSRFSIGTTHFEKVMRFRLNNTVDVEDVVNKPFEFNLAQNYPNPFNPATKIKFVVGDAYYASPVRVVLRVYDVLGNEVATLMNEEKPVGTYEVIFNGAGLASGVYYYKLTAGSFSETKKMLLLK